MASRTLFSRAVATRTLVPASRPILTQRTFIPSQTLGLKESNSADPSPEGFDKHKQDSLAKQKDGKGHWKPELASNSEESVKADREGPQGSTEKHMKELQERTKKAAEDLKKHGTSMHDNM